ncbi:MAG: ATP-dependent DNA helicase RecG [Oscillospiraceae bacterium]|nr:ATP-dependent DNA helicase RecG [Oscillospiraceae bacterium]
MAEAGGLWAGMRGLGPVRLAALAGRGISSPQALLECLPVGYRDTTRPVPIAALQDGQEAAVQGVVARAPALQRAGGRVWVSVTVDDGTGRVRCMWFGQPWMREHLAQGQDVLLYGRAARKQGGVMLVNPSLERETAILPVYRALPGLPAKTYRGLVAQALSLWQPPADALPQGFRLRYDLADRAWALRQAHQPADAQNLARAQRRLAFESLLFYQAALADYAAERPMGVRLPVTRADADAFWQYMPFAPTAAQRRVLGEICEDMASPAAMARMVQGDVGCGKTAVAFGALLLCARAGWQGALMAPTEILAQQHFDGAQKLLQPLGVRCELLTGATPAVQRKRVLQALAGGSCQVAIGTHALISPGVDYAGLGLVITDEQHRFGVRQRSALAQKGASPNVLVLSATPIPRSLALVLYGDLRISVIDELPPGRVPVRTRVVPEEKRADMYAFVRDQAARGGQVYVVCPLVEDGEEGDEAAVSAAALYEELRSGPFQALRVGLVHGRIGAKEKEAVLAAFHARALDVLVATTVIEVGVNVPNATVMIIENADRFGLAQLHQLRGRVGRGQAESWCFLMAAPSERLNLLTRTQDGFLIAKADLETRGAGELFGLRQHGKGLQGPLLGADAALLAETQQAVQALLQDPGQRQDAAVIFDLARKDFADRYGAAALN